MDHYNLRYYDYGDIHLRHSGYKETTDKNGIHHIEKHIMRYPQMFATMAIRDRLDEGIKKGIIWHTQGSGKTALAYSNVLYLRDYFQKQGKIAKFYFIVDRIDLASQAKAEFEARGLKVITVDSKEDFVKNISSIGEADKSGKIAFTVVNIQKFSAESVTKKADYNVNVQRVYFMDEAHRSYNPKGSFLANLMASDREAIMIALTGTPLIGEGYNTKDVFGPYIHKYYYNQSIADGYTLKLIREEIETTYRTQMAATLEQLEVQMGSIKKKDLYSHPKFVKEMVDYIVDDYKKGRSVLDSSIGAMIVCDSSEQAREVNAQLDRLNAYSHALVLHDEGSKQERKDIQEDFTYIPNPKDRTIKKTEYLLEFENEAMHMFQALLGVSEYLYRLRELSLMYDGKIPLMVQERANWPKKIGRNDPCPCGSGKKYKFCHGKN